MYIAKTIDKELPADLLDKLEGAAKIFLEVVQETGVHMYGEKITRTQSEEVYHLVAIIWNEVMTKAIMAL